MPVKIGQSTQIHQWCESYIGSSIFVLPLVPAAVAFLFGLSSSFVLTSDASLCGDLRAFVRTLMVFDYVFVLSFGILLVGPIFISLVPVVCYFQLYFLGLLAVEIFGLTSVVGARSECVSTPPHSSDED
eukprot:755140_1